MAFFDGRSASGPPSVDASAELDDSLTPQDDVRGRIDVGLSRALTENEHAVADDDGGAAAAGSRPPDGSPEALSMARLLSSRSLMMDPSGFCG